MTFVMCVVSDCTADGFFFTTPVLLVCGRDLDVASSNFLLGDVTVGSRLRLMNHFTLFIIFAHKSEKEKVTELEEGEKA